MIQDDETDLYKNIEFYVGQGGKETHTEFELNQKTVKIPPNPKLICDTHGRLPVIAKTDIQHEDDWMHPLKMSFNGVEMKSGAWANTLV